ncbi:MAG: hypothetical protein H6819_01095 [Phycisphaerales bacterium]|nr:hypothetical protein [Phycisphaerales bacterium]MCB9857196.1 hypothetical protein [Phycisphaerales bacterium]MCB9863091.1 hypothetical protein [Phycisphaerales bacterium]
MTRYTVYTSLLIAILAQTGFAQTVTVTTGADVVDVDWQTATIADLPGPDGKVSFSEAMIATNHTPGHQTIAFAIPQEEWTLQFALPGRAVLQTLNGFFLRSFDDVTIDGTTQTAFTGDTNPNGCEVALWGAEVFLNGDNSTIRGFDSTSIQLTGSNGVVEDNTGTTNITVYGGTGNIVRNNRGGTIKIDRANDCVVIGNTVSRVRVQGFDSEFGTGPVMNTRVGGPTLAERNYITGYGTFDGEGYPSGTTVQIFDSSGTIVENNWIGTTPDGLSQGSAASTVGIGFEGINSNAVIRNNRVAAIRAVGIGPHATGLVFGTGIHVYGTGSNISIVGNTVGLNANNEPILGSVTGIDVVNYFQGPVQGVLIGGPNPGDGNEIAGHRLGGVSVRNGVSGATISGNSIYANVEIGIDLHPATNVFGVTPNDALDTDTGGNGLQNFPVLSPATNAGGTMQIDGSLDSHASESYRIEFFSNAVCSNSGFGEGRYFLGGIDVQTNAAGHASFSADLPISGATPSEYLTATATRITTGDTSEFSACVAIDNIAPLTGDIDGNGELDANDAIMLASVLGGLDNDPIHIERCDMNFDGVADGRDIQSFVSAMQP